MRKFSLLAVSNVFFPRSKRSIVAALCGALVASSLAVPATVMAQATTVNFGSVNVGATSTPLPVTLAFNNGATIESTAVLTQGAPGLDFSDAGSATCAVGMAYVAGQTCTVNVTFTPRFAGTRYGAVVLYDTNGNAIASGYVQGTGVGAQVNFLPGTETTIIDSDLSYPSGIAVDCNGNLYIMDAGNNRLVKATPSQGSYVLSAVTTGLFEAFNVAVDGAGDVYVADAANQRILKETPAAGGYTESTVASGFGYPSGIAVDGSGNVFTIANDSILEFTLSPSGYTQSTVVAEVPNAQDLAVDGVGNLYVAEQGYGVGNSAVYKETLTPNGYIQTALTVPGQRSSMSVAVDSFGNVYYLNYPNVYKQTLTPTGYVESVIVAGLTDIGGAYGVAVDGSGNLFIGYAGGNAVVKADFADGPTLNFADAPAGTTSPLRVTLANDGNAPLSLEIPSTGSNPSVSSNFTLDSSSPADCPIVTSASTSPAMLAPGTNCLLPISYSPEISGPVTGTLTLTDNNLNAVAPAYATHQRERQPHRFGLTKRCHCGFFSESD